MSASVSAEKNNGGPRYDMARHSTNPRVAFTISKGDAYDSSTPASLQGNCHTVISVLQDYTHRGDSPNALLVPIGFCIYKVWGARNPSGVRRRYRFKGQRSCNRRVMASVHIGQGNYILVYSCELVRLMQTLCNWIVVALNHRTFSIIDEELG